MAYGPLESGLGNRMKSKHYLIAASALMGVVFVSSNLIMQKVFASARIDFTENNLFTLSNGTKSTLEELAEPVDITFVYSRQVAQEFPAVRAYAARVRELLESYASQSGRKVIIREIDPTPFSPAEDEALAAGITAVNTNGQDPLYFGIIGRNTIDDTRVIPFLAPEREVTLEYDLTRMISRLDDPYPRKVGILSSLSGMNSPGGEGGYQLLQDINKSFEIVPIPDEFQSVPDDLDVLLMAHINPLSDRQSWLIEQYLMRGGSAVILADPAAKIAVANQAIAFSDTPLSSDLGVLGEAWGVTISKRAVADAASALPVPVELDNGRVEERAHPLFIGTPAGDMNQNDLITADLSRTVNMGAPGAILFDNPAKGLTVAPLMQTGPGPSLIDAEHAVRDMGPGEVLRAYQALSGPLTLAARISGKLHSAFPDGAPEIDLPNDPVMAEIARADAENAPKHLDIAAQSSEIIVIADVDLLADDFYIYPGQDIVVADNGALVLNAIDALSGGGALSRLRSRAASQRPMERIDQMRERAEAQYFRQQGQLETRLNAAQARMEELQEIGSSDGFFAGDVEADLTETERAELSELREDIVRLRGLLRDIERDYRRDIDRMENRLKAINIWGGPILVALLGLLIWWRTRQKNGAGA